MGGVPLLYERKYKKEIGPHFTEKMSGITAGLDPVKTALFPNWQGDGVGQCPQFSISLNLAQWNFGSFSTAFPCWMWEGMRWVMIISALFLARRLIFGG